MAQQFPATTGLSTTSVMDAPVRKSNNFNRTNEVYAAYTVDNASGTAATNDFFIVPGVGVAAAKVLPDGITYAGDYPTLAEFQEMLRHVGMEVVEIRFWTNNTANYSGRLFMGDRNPNLRNPQEGDLSMSDYRDNTGGGISDTLVIPTTALPGGSIIITPRTYIKVTNILKNSILKVYLVIGRISKGEELETLSF